MGPVVKTLQGEVEGGEGKDIDGNELYKFLGIPYAKPPVGDLRFKEPQPGLSWIGVRDGTKDGTACYQKNDLTGVTEGSEDCLFLNVFTRDLPSTDHYNLKPVMVFIHGGAFTTGSNSTESYGPDYLLSEDIVLVTINYRLGLLGFLRLKDPSFNVPGNLAFKDQIEALRWVKNNIQQFNGNPDNVTIFGESAGAASVHYHVLSPLSRGLFHKAVLQSGSALSPWSDETDHSAVQIAKIHDSSVSTEKEALALLKGLTVEQLYNIQTVYLSRFDSNSNSMRPLGIVIEPTSRRTAFLTKKPISIILSGDYNKVPLMFGYNNKEGILFNLIRNMRGDARKVMPEHYIPYNVNLKKNEEIRRDYLEKLNNVYFSGPNHDDNVVSLLSDFMFLTGIIASVKNHSQTSAYPVYLYKMSLDTQLNLIKRLMRVEYDGCSHADDLGYLFSNGFQVPVVAGSVEDVSLRRVIRLWTNFAKFGNPTPTDKEFGLVWKPAMARQLNTLHIAEELRMEVNPEGSRMDLWRLIYQQSSATAKYL